MKYLLLLLLGGALMTSCIDDAYDLSNIESDDVTIGDENSEFRAPLAVIHVGMDELGSGSTGIADLCAEADIWLPSDLDGGYVDLERLSSDQTYLYALLDELTAEMLASPAKLEAVATLIYGKYRSQIDIPGADNVDLATYVVLFGEAMRNDAASAAIIAQVRGLAGGYLVDLEIDELDYHVDHIDLDADVIDMITGNIDPEAKPGEKNSLCIYGSIRSELPIALNIRPVLLPTMVAFDIDVEGRGAENAIPETLILASDLESIVNGMTVRIPVLLKRYYPAAGFSSAEEQLTLDLRLVKRGGLTFDNL